MGQDTDPVGNGFVVSLARPGGNITGLGIAPELSGKQPELLKKIVPKPCGRLREFDPAWQSASVKSDGTCCSGVESEASILSDTRSQV